MRLENTDAVYLEFPFLNRFIPREKTSEACASLLDMRVLGLGSHQTHVVQEGYEPESFLVRSLVGSKLKIRYYLLDKEGRPVGRLHTFLAQMLSRKVGQEIGRIGKSAASQVYFVLRVESPSMCLHLYKVPGNVDVLTWLTAETKELREQIRNA